MIIAVIYFVHVIFAVYSFARSYQSEGVVQAVLNVMFIIILFAVSLTVCEIFTGLLIPEAGYSMEMPSNQVLLFFMKISGFYSQQGRTVTLTPKDSITLILVSVLEYYFYRFYFGRVRSSMKTA